MKTLALLFKIVILISLYSCNAVEKIDTGPSILITYHKLAVMDSNAAMDVWGSPFAKKKWNDFAKSVLGDKLQASAFFSSAIILSGNATSNVWVPGFYNPWWNILLQFKFERVDKKMAITDFNLVILNDFLQLDLESSTPKKLATILDNRVSVARKSLDSVFDKQKKLVEFKPTPTNWQEFDKRLKARIVMMRSIFAKDGDSNYKDFRTIFSKIMNVFRGSKDDKIISLPNSVDSQFIKSLTPVYIVNNNTNPIVILSSLIHQDMFFWIWLDLKSEKMVKKWKIINLKNLKQDTAFMSTGKIPN